MVDALRPHPPPGVNRRKGSPRPMPTPRLNLRNLLSGRTHVVALSALTVALAGAGITGVSLQGGTSPKPAHAASTLNDAERGTDAANRSLDRTTAPPVPPATDPAAAKAQADAAAKAAADAAAKAQADAAAAATAKAQADAAAAAKAKADAAAAAKAKADAAAAAKAKADAAAKAKAAAAVPAGCESYRGNQLITCKLLPKFGFGVDQMPALVNLWEGESNWNASAENSDSGAYGIAQALPGDKMSSAGSDWRTNAETQIKWGLQYIADSYGSPQSAWDTWQSRSPHWY